MDSEGEPLRFFDDAVNFDLPPHRTSIADAWHRSFWSHRADSVVESSCSSSSSDGGRLSDAPSSSNTWSGSDGKRWILQNPDFRKLIQSNDAPSGPPPATPESGDGSIVRSVSLSNILSSATRSVRPASAETHQDIDGRVPRRHKLSVVGEDPPASNAAVDGVYEVNPAASATRTATDVAAARRTLTEPSLMKLHADYQMSESAGSGRPLSDTCAADARQQLGKFSIGKMDDSHIFSTFFGLPREIKVSRRELNMMTPSSF